MFKADLDRLYHDEQVKEYLRECKNADLAKQAGVGSAYGGWIVLVVLSVIAVCVLAAVVGIGNGTLIQIAAR